MIELVNNLRTESCILDLEYQYGLSLKLGQDNKYNYNIMLYNNLLICSTETRHQQMLLRYMKESAREPFYAYNLGGYFFRLRSNCSGPEVVEFLIGQL